MTQRERIEKLKDLRKRLDQLKELVKNFFDRYREKVDANQIILSDQVLMNLEWKRLMDIKQRLDQEANQLGVGVGDN